MNVWCWISISQQNKQGNLCLYLTSTWLQRISTDGGRPAGQTEVDGRRRATAGEG
uniref:Uncharacterized protein n=1 Tax=Oryza brachyantha TaxID=4533 RepID=J3M344_ORYBR